MTKSDVLDFLVSQKEYMQSNFGVEKIGLFGSYSRDDYNENSDIDIAVELKKEHIADNFFGLLHFLEDNLHKKIDLGIESNIKKAVKDYVQRDMIYV